MLVSGCVQLNEFQHFWVIRIYVFLLFLLLYRKLLNHTIQPKIIPQNERFILLRCNETILELCYQVLHRWMLDLDPSHLDEATIPTKTWAATCFW